MNTKKVAVRDEEELKLMRKSGRITTSALKKAMESAKPGVSLLELEEIAGSEIKKLGGEASFKTVPGWSWVTCLTINEEVVHGIPRDIKLQDGDILGIDVGAIYKGWCTDAAWTILVQSEKCKVKSQGEKEKFLEAGEETLWRAVEKAKDGGHVGDISEAIQTGIEGAGYSVVKAYAGHGVGRKPHEEPTIETYGKAGNGLKLELGQTLAIEVIYAEGQGEVVVESDGWTASTRDGSLAGLFEMTVIVGQKKGEVITRLV